MAEPSTSNSNEAKIFELIQTQREWNRKFEQSLLHDSSVKFQLTSSRLLVTGYQNTTLPTNAVDYLKAKIDSTSRMRILQPVSFKSSIDDETSMIGQYQPDTEKFTTRRVISQLGDHLSDIDRDVLEQQLQMNAELTFFEHFGDQAIELCDAHSDHEGRLVRRKVLLSPFRNLPVEILIIVFQYAAAGKNPTPPAPIVLHLSRVCSQWRQILLSLPEFWNRQSKEGTVSLQHTESDLLSVQFSTLHNYRPNWMRFKSIAPFHHRLSHINIKMDVINLYDLLFFPGARELQLKSLVIITRELKAVFKKSTHTLTCPSMSKFRIYVYGKMDSKNMDLSRLHLPALTTVELAFNPFDLDAEMPLSIFFPSISHSFKSVRRFSLFNIQCTKDELISCFRHMNILKELVLFATSGVFLECFLPSLSIASSLSSNLGNVISVSIVLAEPSIPESNDITKGLADLIASWMKEDGQRQSLRTMSLRYVMVLDVLHIQEIVSFEEDLEEFKSKLEQRERKRESECGFTISTAVDDSDIWDYDFSDWSKIA